MKVTKSELEQKIGEYFSWQAGEIHIDLRRLADGTLSPGEKQAAQEHLSGCPSCRQILEAIESVEDIWTGNSPSLAEPHNARRSPRFLWAWSAFALAAACSIVLVLIFLTRPKIQPEPESDGFLISKGGFQLHVAVNRAGQGLIFQAGDRLFSGDQIGFFYTSESDGFLMILYGDYQGRFELLYPAKANASAPVGSGSQVRIPDGAIISPGQGCEWIVGLFTVRPLSIDQAQEISSSMWKNREGCQLKTVWSKEIKAVAIEVRR